MSRCMESLGMWEDVLSVVDDEISNDEGRLFKQDSTWDGSQYIRYHMLCSVTKAERRGWDPVATALNLEYLRLCTHSAEG